MFILIHTFPCLARNMCSEAWLTLIKAIMSADRIGLLVWIKTYCQNQPLLSKHYMAQRKMLWKEGVKLYVIFIFYMCVEFYIIYFIQFIDYI